MFTAYQSKYFAHEITKRYGSDSLEKLAGTVASAQVDLNPHQVDAALFAFKSPLSKGAILADEVGLGKTIEAGLVMAQKWAENKRRILVVTPSNLRKQWHQEMTEKFFLPCHILDSKSYRLAIQDGKVVPFDLQSSIVICSYQFAKSRASDIKLVQWDLVVMDEAHRLRNVYKPANVIAKALRDALIETRKLLLTATPLQNSLLELYGLVSFIDERVFGDLTSFREQYLNLGEDSAFETLKARLKPICHRTLRRQVAGIVQYTKRFAIVQEFTPEDAEDRLYNLVSDYLRRDNLQALAPGQRSLITLVLRKLLASSTFAIAGALNSMASRLRAKLDKVATRNGEVIDLAVEYESLENTKEEWTEENAEQSSQVYDSTRALIEQEILDLEGFRDLATSIKRNAKGDALLTALEVAFRKAKELGAAEKAIIFTESRKTQDYLLRVLADSDFSEGVVLFNGTNSDPRSKQIYAEWLQRHKETDRVTGSQTADLRAALVDYFRETGRIMIATEAGAEGINLQFCSLVVNYDLPWNPQRIEQRIGRCHRYGQQHDVVVVNFLNRKNDADKRVFELLSEMFKLFEGVFGASDEVLGIVESGVDFEKRISEIYNNCRGSAEIKQAFDRLQVELGFEIDETMARTRQKLLENFDDEVREKLRVRDSDSKAYLNRFETLLMRFTQNELNGEARFINDSSFELLSSPFPDNTEQIPLGLYELPRRSGNAHFYRAAHPLAEALVHRAKARQLEYAGLLFDYAAYTGKISVLEPLRGQAGSLVVSLCTVESLEQIEDYLILAAVTDKGETLLEEIVQGMMRLPAGIDNGISPFSSETTATLESMIADRETQIRKQIGLRNVQFFEAEADKLERWADDMKLGLERDIKDLDREIRETRRSASAALTLEEKIQGQKKIKTLESLRNQKRRSLFDAQDEVDKQREELIASIETKLEQRVTQETLFAVRWELR